MIRTGELKDFAEAARLAAVTRARMTQITNLLLLAPEIQDDILKLQPVIKEHDLITEHALRFIVSRVDWKTQKTEWKKLKSVFLVRETK